jgi:hypothetical protein
MAHTKGQRVRTFLPFSGDKDRQVFGIRLALICSDITDSLKRYFFFVHFVKLLGLI